MKSDLAITNNTERRRFETEINNELAYVEYGFYNKSIMFIHTFVPEAARGQGIAIELARFVLEYAKEKEIKIVVICPVISKYLRIHPEYQDLIDKTYKHKKL